jgi:hypothetical protein
MLRMLLGTRAGGTSPLARLIAILLIVALLGLSVPVLIPVFRWVIGLL